MSEGKYFVRGIARIIVAIAALAVVILACNVIGYLLVQTGFFYVWGDTYPARALNLAWLGFRTTALLVGALILAYYLLPQLSRVIISGTSEVLSATYKSIAYIGGYREEKEKTDDI